MNKKLFLAFIFASSILLAQSINQIEDYPIIQSPKETNTVEAYNEPNKIVYYNIDIDELDVQTNNITTETSTYTTISNSLTEKSSTTLITSTSSSTKSSSKIR